jgi:DNA-directed RNA polymerase subunit RPC12/RpoP
MQQAVEANIEIREMWTGGPLRKFSTMHVNSTWKPYESAAVRGYVSGYVCKDCMRDVLGVHWTSDGWKCARCRHNRKSQPEKGKNAASCERGGVR